MAPLMQTLIPKGNSQLLLPIFLHKLVPDVRILCRVMTSPEWLRALRTHVFMTSCFCDGIKAQGAEATDVTVQMDREIVTGRQKGLDLSSADVAYICEIPNFKAN